jgi:threonine dehydratase
MQISLSDIKTASERVAPYIQRTPTLKATNSFFEQLLPDSEVYLKYELFQVSGTFKIRGVLNNLLSIDNVECGVTAASAGNHAIAVAMACKILGLDAKVVMQSSANPARIAAAKKLGAKIIIAKDGTDAFALAHDLEEEEGRLFIHPFDGMHVAEATAAVAQEMHADVEGLDTIVVAIGGGGLAGGVAAGSKLIRPECQVLGAEPKGAAVMTASFKIGSATTLDELNTIADSLAPPMTTDITYALCKKNMDALCTVSDDQMLAACYLLGRDHKVVAEPACGAAAAAALDSYRERLKGKKVGIILCGSNIDVGGYAKQMQQGELAIANGIFEGI